MGSITLSIPQVNSPDSTEDPKIANNFTLLQTLLNGNLDSSNLSATIGFLRLTYRQLNSSNTAASGDWITAAPGITVTLPAPSANAIVSVLANNAVTSASPVTVSGTNIYGLGLSAASSFLLGTAMRSVILESDGASWAIVTGMQDTGWVNLSAFGTSIVAGTPAPQSRLIGDQVYLRGTLHDNAGSVAGGGTLVTLPAGQRPPASRQYVAPVAGSAAVLTVASTGVVSSALIVGNNQDVLLDVVGFSL